MSYKVNIFPYGIQHMIWDSFQYMVLFPSQMYPDLYLTSGREVRATHSLFNLMTYLPSVCSHFPLRFADLEVLMPKDGQFH